MPRPHYQKKILHGRFDLTTLALSQPKRYPYLLESTALPETDHHQIGRYDILMAYPQQTLIKTSADELYSDSTKLDQGSFLAALDTLWVSNKTTSPQDLPFTGGWFLFLSYELSGEIEPKLKSRTIAPNLPVAQATRIPAAIVHDHVDEVYYLVAENEFANCISAMEQDLNNAKNGECSASDTKIRLREEKPNDYINGIKRILNYIRDGDVFQVNLSRGWDGQHQSRKTAGCLYKRLRTTNPAPFSGLVQLPPAAILSSSPERLVRVKNGMIETRPIAGTRPRGKTSTQDSTLHRELISHPKERAEHIMLIDLERNDLGRLAIPGSIHVDEFMTIESYSHVHHIVSNITAKLKHDITPGQIIAAVFPGGTITGCPKVRCMEIISEIENGPRGAYTGSFGYLNHNGDMDLNILIRSMVVDEQTIVLRTGAGLVADSDPQKELDETRAKAQGLLKAFQ